MRSDLTNVWVFWKIGVGRGYGRSATPSGVGWEIRMSGVWGTNPHKKTGGGSGVGRFGVGLWDRGVYMVATILYLVIRSKPWIDMFLDLNYSGTNEIKTDIKTMMTVNIAYEMTDCVDNQNKTPVQHLPFSIEC